MEAWDSFLFSLLCLVFSVLTTVLLGPPPRAGDAYAAGLLYGLFHGASVVDMGNLAALVASYVVKKPGAALTEADAARALSSRAIERCEASSVARALGLPYPRCSRVRLGQR